MGSVWKEEKNESISRPLAKQPRALLSSGRGCRRSLAGSSERESHVCRTYEYVIAHPPDPLSFSLPFFLFSSDFSLCASSKEIVDKLKDMTHSPHLSHHVAHSRKMKERVQAGSPEVLCWGSGSGDRIDTSSCFSRPLFLYL